MGPVPGATQYRWLESEHSPGKVVATTTDPVRTSPALARGHYTYSVVAVVDGVETPASAEVGILVDGTPRTETEGSTPPPPPTQTGLLDARPPMLNNPVTLKVTQGNTWHKLDVSRDYIIELPKGSYLQGGLWLDGGHNIQIIGGGIEAAGRDALKPKNYTGSLYIEGVDLGGKGTSYATEGIQVYAPRGGNITIQNVKVRRVHGTQTTNHADIFQFYCGKYGVTAQLLRVDGTTDFQGIMLQPDNVSPGRVAALWRMHDVVLRRPGTTKGVLVNASNNSDTDTPRDFRNVWLVSAKTQSGDNPPKTEAYPAVVAATPGMKQVKPGDPRIPDVLLGTPGPNYVSPGYRDV